MYIHVAGYARNYEDLQVLLYTSTLAMGFIVPLWTNHITVLNFVTTMI